jgi:hypothetical protein
MRKRPWLRDRPAALCLGRRRRGSLLGLGSAEHLLLGLTGEQRLELLALDRLARPR